jgi:magnesium chelatase family protein
MRARYRARISGPLLDRFDLIVAVGRVEATEYDGPRGEPSSVVAARVEGARRAQHERGRINRYLSPAEHASTGESAEARRLVTSAVDNGVLTARGADRVRRVARTIADLMGTNLVDEAQMAEALGLRGEWRDD